MLSSIRPDFRKSGTLHSLPSRSGCEFPPATLNNGPTKRLEFSDSSLLESIQSFFFPPLHFVYAGS